MKLTNTACAATCLVSLAAAAQELPDDPVATIYVVASRSLTKVAQMPLHTTIVTQEQLRLSPAQTVDQLLRDVPGMNFTAVPAAQSDPTGHQSKMRGLGNAKVLMLLDGIPMHDPFYLTTQWFKVPLTNIERIEVLRGGNSSLWGNMAVAGVVNIVTKRPRAGGGELLASAGSQGSWNLAVSADAAVSDTVRLSLSADQYHIDGYQQTPEAHLYRFPDKRPTAADNRNVSLTAHVQPGDGLQGYLRLGYHVQDQQIGYRYGRNLQKSPDLALHVERTLPKRTRIEANAWTQLVDFDKYNGSTCYYQGGSTCLASTSTALTPDKVNANVVQYYTQHGALRYRESGSALIYSTHVNPTVYGFVGGVDVRRLSADDAEEFYNAPAAPSVPQGRFDSATSGTGLQSFYGLFGQVKLLPFEALDVTLSGRIDRYTIGQRDNRRTLASDALTGGPLPSAGKTAFDPSVALRYTLDASTSLRGAAYKAFRAPGFNNLTRTFGTGTSTTIANPDLVPENLRGWELGADYRNGGATLGLTWFRYNIRDMIATFTARAGSAPQQVQLICGGATLPNCGGAARYYTNDQDGRSQGLELIAAWRQSTALQFDLFATRTESILTRRGAVVTDPLGVQLAGVPKNTATVGMNWSPAAAWRTRVQARYTGGMLLDTTSSAGLRFAQGAVTVVDGSVDYRWSARVSLFARATNLLDRRYSENAYSINQPYSQTLSPPRAATLGIRASM